jgi:anti-sigma B factor antagonist
MMQTTAATPLASTPASPGMRIRSQPLEGPLCVVAVEGEIDLATAPELKASLGELLEQGHRRFVIDLSDVAHLDSTGLGVLIGFDKRLNGDGVLAIAAAPRHVWVVFEVTGLGARFASFPTVDEAVSQLQGRVPPGSALSTDAAMAIGLASTALPFAESPAAEAERWLRILRRIGDAARALAPADRDDAPRDDRGDTANGSSPNGAQRRDCGEVINRIIEAAARTANRRAEPKIGTAHVLAAVMDEYGVDFDRALQTAGIDRNAVLERLGRPKRSARLGP